MGRRVRGGTRWAGGRADGARPAWAGTRCGACCALLSATHRFRECPGIAWLGVSAAEPFQRQVLGGEHAAKPWNDRGMCLFRKLSARRPA